MGMQLPAELASVAAAAGVRWPQGDETKMRETAKAWELAGTRVAALAGDADSAAHAALSAFDGDAADAAARYWSRFVRGDSGHFNATAKGCREAAERLNHAANEIAAAKAKIVEKLVALAKNMDAAETAAAAGNENALLNLSWLIKGTAANIAHIQNSLLNTVQAIGSSVTFTNDLVSANPGQLGSVVTKLLGTAVATATQVVGDLPGAVGHGIRDIVAPAIQTVTKPLKVVGNQAGGIITNNPVLDPGLTPGATKPPLLAVPPPVAGSVIQTPPISHTQPVTPPVGGPSVQLPEIPTNVPPPMPVPSQPPHIGGPIDAVQAASAAVIDAPSQTSAPVGQPSTGSPGGGSTVGGVQPGGTTAAPPSGNPLGGRLTGVNLGGPPVVGNIPSASTPSASPRPGTPGMLGVPAQTPGGGKQLAPPPQQPKAQQPVRTEPGARAAEQAAKTGESTRSQPGAKAANTAARIGDSTSRPLADQGGKAAEAPKSAPRSGEPTAKPQVGAKLADLTAKTVESQPNRIAEALQTGKSSDAAKPGDLAKGGDPAAKPGESGKGNQLGQGKLTAAAPQPDQPVATPDQADKSAEKRDQSGGFAVVPLVVGPLNGRADKRAQSLMQSQMFPVGHMPVVSLAPVRQLAPPHKDVDFAAGLRFPPGDHPRSELADSATAVKHSPPTRGRTAPDLLHAHDPQGGMHERDWDRRFLVRPFDPNSQRPTEYAWPTSELYPEGGAAPGEAVVLPVGTVLDRFGTSNGRVFSADGTRFARRSLPPAHASAGYRRYRVVQPLPVWRAMSAPWFGQPGGGERYRATHSAAELVALGLLEETP
ncbi:glycohydrolase toxin TNT-related protein [Actinokineospora diospyrosa]|uniref:DUF4237 domain-containing protein n=1 Tax=Actinokineospora diospyrosa TaxID=103728 RepID=A0ABT1II67_9PSEU|nr:glycohydrolase toxin TNT-related protein [Actinokineospora diospyrosa]MCP2272324.1 Protein of unknown function (DUF4237) [Actinokineospora diospyrosa]